jgi:peroxiredoxin
MRRLIVLLGLGVLLVGSSANAQQKESEAASDARQFQTVLTKLAGHLQSSGTYAVEVASDWKIVSEDKKREKQGRNRFKLVRESGNRLRIEANPGDQLQPTVLCVCDGKQLTTYLRPSGIYERKATTDAAAEVLHSQFLTTALQGTGLDLLLMKDWPKFVESSIGQLDAIGKEKVAGEELDHYQMVWGKDVVGMWFKPGNAPLLTQFQRTVTVPVQEKTSVKVVTTVRLKWTLAQTFPPATFQADMPATARLVPSVYEALVKGEKAVILGKPAPRLSLKLVDGKPLDLAGHANKEVVVLFYFATWALPDIERLQTLTKLAQDWSRQGVKFYLVNVGETNEEVAKFTTTHKLTLPVALDQNGKSTDDFLINAIPAAVLIARNGTVQAVLQGPQFEQDVANQLTRDLSRLVKGESLLPTK